MDFQQGLIHIRTTKNGHPRYVPIPLPLMAHLQGILRVEGNPFVFPGRGVGPIRDFRTAWEFALARAKISNFRIHDLRHSFASYFMMSGESIYELKEILGHRTITMTEKYTHMAPGHLRAGVDRMARKMADGSLFTGEGMGAGTTGERLAG